MDRFTGGILALLSVVNSERSDYSKICDALTEIEKGVGACITPFLRQTLIEKFADIDSLLNFYELEQTNLLKGGRKQKTKTDADQDFNIIDTINEQCENFIEIPPSDEDVARLKKYVSETLF